MIISNYEIGNEIGSGAFGTVNIGEDVLTASRRKFWKQLVIGLIKLCAGGNINNRIG